MRVSATVRHDRLHRRRAARRTLDSHHFGNRHLDGVDLAGSTYRRLRSPLRDRMLHPRTRSLWWERSPGLLSELLMHSEDRDNRWLHG